MEFSRCYIYDVSYVKKHHFSSLQGRQKASEMWLESNLKWTDFMPADKVDIFLEKEGLDWMQVCFVFIRCLNKS